MSNANVFNVTFEIVTRNSATNGDVEERGFVAKSVSLRDAIREVFDTRTSSAGAVECVECDSIPMDRPRWVTVVNGPEFDDAAQESRSLHIPTQVTRSTARRIARLMGVAA